MAKTFVVCSILAPEVEKAMDELGLKNRLCYISGALHIDLDKLENAITEGLDEVCAVGEEPALIVGTKCHPDIGKLADSYGSKIICGSNCIELLLGEEKLRELNDECETFYITAGWLKQRREIFCEGGLGWDSVDGRINFGRYERILLLDTGLAEASDEDIFEFYDFTEVPIETYPVTPDNIKKRILEIAE